MAKVPSIDDLPNDEAIGVYKMTADRNECDVEEKKSTIGLIDVASPTSVMLNRFEGSFCDRAMARSLGLRKVEMDICK